MRIPPAKVLLMRTHATERLARRDYSERQQFA